MNDVENKSPEDGKPIAVPQMAIPIAGRPPESRPKRPRSWLSWFFGYVRMLEYNLDVAEREAERLRRERDSIFDRMVRLTTGFSMAEEMPDAIEVEKRTQEIQKPRNMHDFRGKMTADSLERFEANIKKDAIAEEEAKRKKEGGGTSGDDTAAKTTD